MADKCEADFERVAAQKTWGYVGQAVLVLVLEKWGCASGFIGILS